MITFDLPRALFFVFLSLLPGVALSFALFFDRKRQKYSLIDLFFVGLGIGMVVVPLIPFLAYILLGINFSNIVAYVSIILAFLLSLLIYVVMKKKAGEMKNEKEENKNAHHLSFKLLLPSFLLILILLYSFLTRLATLSPIYAELDPYFYLYTPQQILIYGHALRHDWTAWYPEVHSGHLGKPIMAYIEAIWYRLYAPTGYNLFTLSYVGNLYPPLAGMLAVFFVYFGLKAFYKEEWALPSALILSVIPIFFLKTVAGECEAQPFAFFSLSMFFAFISWMIKTRDWKWAVLAGIAYSAVAMGSSSGLVAGAMLCSSIIVFSALNFLKNDVNSLKTGLILFALVFIFGPLFVTFSSSLYVGHVVEISFLAASFLSLLFLALLFFLLSKESNHFIDLGKFKNRVAFLSVLCVIGLIFLFTPLGEPFLSIAKRGLGIAEISSPLTRTIAEQATAGKILSGQLGPLATPLPIPKTLDPACLLMNVVFDSLAKVLSVVSGHPVDINPKEPSLLQYLTFLVFFSIGLALWRWWKNEEERVHPFLLFSLAFVPMIFIGWIKAKYIIYLGWLIAIGLGCALAELDEFFSNSKYPSSSFGTALFFVVILFACWQLIASPSFAISKYMFKPRFQDNPALFAEKFRQFCSEMKGDNSGVKQIICDAAKDPVEFANRDINNQFDFNLCVLSQLDDLPTTSEDLKGKEGAIYRCQRISDYWIEAMEWIRNSTPKDARIISWWDYGHWINFFGQRNAVIRNEHRSHKMIMQVAYDFIMADTSTLIKDMHYFNATYALFDQEIIMGGGGFGGKFGALNYLACSYVNQTNANIPPGWSRCEWENRWEEVLVPSSPSSSEICQISANETGVIAYELVPEFNEKDIVTKVVKVPKYCLGKTKLVTGQTIPALYELDKQNEDGSLVLHKAFIKTVGKSDNDDYIIQLFYTKDPVWVENGNISDGFSDHTSRFYDSNLYKAFILGELDGFELVYSTKGNEVKIFKLLNKINN